MSKDELISKLERLGYKIIITRKASTASVKYYSKHFEKKYVDAEHSYEASQFTDMDIKRACIYDLMYRAGLKKEKQEEFRQVQCQGCMRYFTQTPSRMYTCSSTCSGLVAKMH